MPKHIDLVGQRFGRLVVIGEAGKINSRKSYHCLCDCGGKKTATSSALRNDGTMSCGCLRAENNRRMAAGRVNPLAKRGQLIYKRWGSMKQRCTNPKNPFYKNYGARGIFVCAEWLDSYDAFIRDMGLPPTEKHTLERIDNDGPYAPENCRWALRGEQLRNQRKTILIEIKGEKLAAVDWAKRTGIHYQKITKEFRVNGIDGATALVAAALE
jgi:hypothetical protein